MQFRWAKKWLRLKYKSTLSISSSNLSNLQTWEKWKNFREHLFGVKIFRKSAWFMTVSNLWQKVIFKIFKPKDNLFRLMCDLNGLIHAKNIYFILYHKNCCLILDFLNIVQSVLGPTSTPLLIRSGKPSLFPSLIMHPLRMISSGPFRDAHIPPCDQKWSFG